MISVLNPRQRLSGSKILFLIVLSIFLTSCGGTDRATKRTNKKNNKGTTTTPKVTDVKKKDKVKEIDWTEGNDEDKPPIENEKPASDAKVEIIKESVYDITYFIPFDVNDYMNSSNRSDRFIQYYSGLQVATRILEREGVNLRINVVDEKKRKFDNILKEEVNSSTDVIVGPYDRNDLRMAAEFALKNKIPIVSPWQASNSIAEDNPFYVQLRPNLDEHYYSIFEDVKKKFDLDRVYLVSRGKVSNDVKRTEKLQKMAMDVWGESDTSILQEVNLIQDSIDMGGTAFELIFDLVKPTVIIIPNWSFEDEAFIYGALRRLSVEKGLSDVIVYGMPIMLESEKINFDYYSSLKMRVARSNFVDDRDYDVRRFKSDFLNKYGTLPSSDAYEGYDHLMYIGRNLYRYGKNFQYYLFEDKDYYLQARYRVESIRKDSPDDSYDKINYFENKNIDIIEFKENRFVRNLDK